MHIFKQKIRRVVEDERGLGTIEIVIILAVLVGLAFLFHAFAKGFFSDITKEINNNTKIDSLFSMLWII